MLGTWRLARFVLGALALVLGAMFALGTKYEALSTKYKVQNSKHKLLLHKFKIHPLCRGSALVVYQQISDHNLEDIVTWLHFSS